MQSISIKRSVLDETFEGIGAVNGGGATAALLKDYPAPQRDEILDLVFSPRYGASVSTMLVEIPGDGNATQGSMPSHQHVRDELESHRGYTWWILREAKRRNPGITLDAVAWSAPGWIGDGTEVGWVDDEEFWSQDAVDYYVNWLRILRDDHELELDAIGCRNEKGVSLKFAQLLRKGLDAAGFEKVRIHGFDNWPADKFDFVEQLADNPEAAGAIDVIGVHVLYERPEQQTPPAVRQWARENGKPIWNTEDHVYTKGFDSLISIVECFNESYLLSGATKTVLWYDIAGVYPTEPYSEDPAMILAREPWSASFMVREALWGYAHYGQFTDLGWTYLADSSIMLDHGGTWVTLASDTGEYSAVVETKAATRPQLIMVDLDPVLSSANLTVWRSTAEEQFVELDDVSPVNGRFEVTLQPDAVYTFSTTRGQRKGEALSSRVAGAFPFPYRDDFTHYGTARERGFLPQYTADIAGAFELVDSPDSGTCLRQVVPRPTVSWAPDWHPYTIIGDASWTDYEITVEIRLGMHDSAGVLGRVEDVGSGYGFIPKAYLFEVGSDGHFRLVDVNGKENTTELIGDAEQQALILSQTTCDEGGEHVLASGTSGLLRSDAWHTVTLRFHGQQVTGLLDGVVLASASTSRHRKGMAGLWAAATKERVSTPYFRGLRMSPVGCIDIPPTPVSGAPLYSEDR